MTHRVAPQAETDLNEIWLYPAREAAAWSAQRRFKEAGGV
jgi:hypothetical protein